MNIYRYLRLLSARMPAWIKISGLAGMHLMGKRTLGIFLDPVGGCNLRCRMCYFSSAEKPVFKKKSLTEEELSAIASSLFHRALKLQIGCGTEPTLYPALEEIIRLGVKAGIPYISITTNGQLIASGRVDLRRLAEAGLNEITLSMHGTSRTTYEYLMQGASFDAMRTLVGILAGIKKDFPDFRIRVNFTINSMNMRDLSDDSFRNLWKECKPDIIQLRPVQEIGDSDWRDFDPAPLEKDYDNTIGKFAEECRSRGITCIAPTKDQLRQVTTSQSGATAVIEDFSYCYISPDSCYKEDFKAGKDTYESYHRRHHSFRRLLRAAFSSDAKRRNRKVSKKLNYTVK